jgi:hypothetical protein
VSRFVETQFELSYTSRANARTLDGPRLLFASSRLYIFYNIIPCYFIYFRIHYRERHIFLCVATSVCSEYHLRDLAVLSSARSVSIRSPFSLRANHWCSFSRHTVMKYRNLRISRFGGVVFSVLATGPKGRRFKPGRGDGFLKAIKIRSTPCFGWKVKAEAPCRKIVRLVKDPLTYLRYWYTKFSLFRPFLLLAPRCLCW